MSTSLRITLERSVNGTTKLQRATVFALGLKKRGSSHTVPDRPELRGMIQKVAHLVKVEEIQ